MNNHVLAFVTGLYFLEKCCSLGLTLGHLATDSTSGQNDLKTLQIFLTKMSKDKMKGPKNIQNKPANTVKMNRTYEMINYYTKSYIVLISTTNLYTDYTRDKRDNMLNISYTKLPDSLLNDFIRNLTAVNPCLNISYL